MKTLFILCIAFLLSACNLVNDDKSNSNNKKTNTTIMDSWISKSCIDNKRDEVVFSQDKKSLMIQTNVFSDSECQTLDKVQIQLSTHLFYYEIINEREMYVSKVETGNFDVDNALEYANSLDVHDGNPEIIYYEFDKSQACFSSNVLFRGNDLVVTPAENPNIDSQNCFGRNDT